jgi:hypothetical protein
MSFSDSNLRHTRTRATGQIWVGPMRELGYDKQVMSITLSDIEFKNSDDADRFVDAQRRKFATGQKLKSMNRLRYLGRSDGDD